MKRDPELVRQVLIEVEEVTGPDDWLMYVPEEHGEEKVYVAHLLADAGYLDVVAERMGGILDVRGLTWRGHDLLDAIRDDTVWRRTRDKVTSTVGSVSIEVLKGVAEGVAKGMMGLG